MVPEQGHSVYTEFCREIKYLIPFFTEERSENRRFQINENHLANNFLFKYAH